MDSELKRPHDGKPDLTPSQEGSLHKLRDMAVPTKTNKFLVPFAFFLFFPSYQTMSFLALY